MEASNSNVNKVKGVVKYWISDLLRRNETYKI
jgi:hypothetical protein